MEVDKLIDSLKGTSHRVLVVGLGKSGVAALRYLTSSGICVCGVDQKIRSSFSPELLSELEASGVELYFEDKVARSLAEFALMVISPGIPLNSPILRDARTLRLPIVSEMELGMAIAKLPCIAVTGSNGKSTTVSLVAELLKGQGYRPKLCGNIGTPIVETLCIGEEVVSNSQDLLVVEASSYQLESVNTFKPIIGIWLNLSENHLERHGSLDAYGAAKIRMFERQDQECFSIVNVDDRFISSRLKEIPGKICAVSTNASNPELGSRYAIINFHPASGVDRITISMDRVTEEIELRSCPLLGLHNRYNIAASLLAVYAWSLKSGRIVNREALIQAVTGFRTLSHRIEPLIITDDLVAINDSKSTTVASSVVALVTVASEFPGRMIKLLLGGKSKKGSWEPLALKAKEFSAILEITCFGADGAAISQELSKEGIRARVFATMKEAVDSACNDLLGGDVLLFSPGCASFDEFSDFEARGNMFRSMICRRYPNSSPSLPTERLAS